MGRCADGYGNCAAGHRSAGATGHEHDWVYSLSTPFLTRLPAEALARIVARLDGLAGTIVEKYCDWVCKTSFLFHYADTVCSRLEAILDAGTPTNKAHALIAMIELGDSHNRWYVMRVMLRCCGKIAYPTRSVAASPSKCAPKKWRDNCVDAYKKPHGTQDF
jgi:hypothetical protein